MEVGVRHHLDHVAILWKSSGLLEKILVGEKKIESRWYSARFAPWDRIFAGDTVYFKYAGMPVRAKARVSNVKQFSELTPTRIKGLWARYGKLIGVGDIAPFVKSTENKKYCVLVFLEKAQRVKPFNINKVGFGNGSAWLLVENVNTIKNDC